MESNNCPEASRLIFEDPHLFVRVKIGQSLGIDH